MSESSAKPMSCVARQATMGFSGHKYWSGLPSLSPGYLPSPGIQPGSPALWRSLHCRAPREAHFEDKVAFSGKYMVLEVLLLQRTVLNFPVSRVGEKRNLNQSKRNRNDLLASRSMSLHLQSQMMDIVLIEALSESRDCHPSG